MGAPGWQFFVPLVELAYMFMSGQGPQPDQMYNGIASPSEKVDNGLNGLVSLNFPHIHNHMQKTPAHSILSL